MRTTVTLDEDVEILLKEVMHAQRRSFKETLNDALRAGLRANRPANQGEPFRVEARPLGLRAGIDPGGLNKLLDEMEEVEFLRSQAEASKP